MKLKKIMVASILVASTGMAQAGVSGNIALTSDYVWRGISQSNDNVAVQGGFDYEHDSGAYAGIWASNVEFGGPGSIETDFKVGFANSVGDFSYDVWYLDYLYPNDAKLNFDEIGFSVGYDLKVVSFSAGVSTNEIIVKNDDTGTYYEAGMDIPAGPITISTHIGKYDLKAHTDDYLDWKIGASAEFAGFGFDLSYSDTDMSDDGLDGEQVMLTISKSL